MKKKANKEYCVAAVCHVCSKKFLARFNMVGRAKTCTPPTHKCQRKTVQVPGRRDKLISCVDGCCKSKYYKGTASSAASEIDSRKFLSDGEYEKVLKATYKVEDPFGLALRFTIETGCRCGETLLSRRHHFDFREGKLSVVRVVTLKKAGHPLLPVYLDNSSKIVEELRVYTKKLKPDDLLFPIAKRTFQRVFERILDKIKPDRASLIHILRHTRASRLVRSGMDLNTVRKQMRWASIELLKTYGHTTEDEVADAFGKMQ